MKNMLSEEEAMMPMVAQGSHCTHVITVTSGKGGVGKTNVVANLAVELSRAGKRVLVLDADLGLGNIDVLLGLVPLYTLEHVLRGSHHLSRSSSRPGWNPGIAGRFRPAATHFLD